MSQPDPYQTRPLPPLTQTLARPVQLPLGAIAALIVVPALLLTGLVLWWGSTQRPAPLPVVLLATPTLGVPHAATAPTLPRATVAYAAPGGQVVGALEPGRAYQVVARSGLAWVQLDVALLGEPANLVWVAADAVPEMRVAAGVTDLATPEPTAAPQVVYVAAPAAGAAPEAPAPAAEVVTQLVPAPTPAMLIPPEPSTLRSVVVRPFPTTPPCSLRELGSVLRICNGVTP
ncbi:MAG: hypothetical protein HGA45_32455 [Chloroflexales bacterium]|nr:hypothetical protein [Chloroflexales bacterium]